MISAAFWFSIGSFVMWLALCLMESRTRHPWYSPSSWVSSALLEIASKAPDDLGMMIAAIYGVVEVCGLKRASRPLFALLKARIERGLKKHAS